VPARVQTDALAKQGSISFFEKRNKNYIEPGGA
jgi:hypothetical protein